MRWNVGEKFGLIVTFGAVPTVGLVLVHLVSNRNVPWSSVPKSFWPAPEWYTCAMYLATE